MFHPPPFTFAGTSKGRGGQFIEIDTLAQDQLEAPYAEPAFWSALALTDRSSSDGTPSMQAHLAWRLRKAILAGCAVPRE